VEVFGRTWLTAIAAIIVMYALLRVIALLVTERGRLRLAATIARIWRWEFWPAWLFYIPTAIYIAYLSIRHGGFNVITAANPAIPLGGFVGESKCEILRQLDATFVVPFARVTSAGELYPLMNDRGWRFPIILKPDVGERGASVRRISNLAQAEQYLAGHPGPTLVQPFHPGPHEAGIFYYRLPGAARGEIFSITDKILSELIGDGTSTFEELIWRHSRYRMQATVFLKRHAEHKDRILQNGERFLLAMAGNHCQGTMFRDGIHLVTPKLAARIDQIARSFEGFFIGRFDVRYSDVAQFMAGKDLAIVELNGVTAESSNIYDPRASLLAAYRTMFRQWRILFAIAKTNIARGHCPAGHCEMLRALFRHYINRRPDPLAD
ncbi:MAG TPA: hypothetical protein VL282_06625, partial [Tepidisphaeraceae bacterium]|nr:hypothetical protein [Tepidisphaeraceae bacterium]